MEDPSELELDETPAEGDETPPPDATPDMSDDVVPSGRIVP